MKFQDLEHLRKLRWTRPGNSSVTAFVGVIEVDGEILVDKGNFGPNGFYLPFDSDKTPIETCYDGRDGYHLLIMYTTFSTDPILQLMRQHESDCD